MLRFIKHNLTSIEGVDIYPLLSLLIFVLFFVVVLIRVVKMSKEDITELSSLPIDSEVDESLDQYETKNQ